MSLHRRLLIAIADGGQVRFVRPSSNNALHTDVVFDSASMHKRSAALGTDHPGAAFHSDASAHHALSPRHDPHDLEKERFAYLVADQLNAAAARNEFDDLVIVAPPHSMNAIRKELNNVTDATVIGTLEKDLVKTPDHELWPHLREWVRPVHRMTEQR